MFSDESTMMAVIEATGWSLIHFIWQGLLVAAVYAIGRRMLHDRHPICRYYLGLVCMVMLAVLPVITAISTYTPHTVEASAPSVSASNAIAAVAVSATESVDISAAVREGLPWLVAAWAAGVLLLASRVFINWRRMKRLLRVGTRPLSDRWQQRVEYLVELFQIRSAVKVVESTLVEVPTVLGWLKPVILLPTSSFVGLTPQQLELVIAHELGHIRRLDYIVNLFQVAVETVLFYHPAVGWISRSIREEREKCCDDLVISRCGQPMEYAKALANLESIRSGHYSPALAATDGVLFERIERIVCNHKAEPREALIGNGLVLLTLAAIVVLGGRLGDPLAALEAQRSRIADALVAELLTETLPSQSEALLAPLESARASFLPEPVAIEQQSAVADETVAITSPTLQTPAASNVPVDSRESTTIETQTAPPPEPEFMGAEEASVPVGEPVALMSIVVDNDATRLPPPQPFVTDTPAPALSSSLPAAQEPEPDLGILRQVDPSYPVQARIAGQTGYVELSFRVDSSGRPVDIEIEDSHPRRVFERAAISAIKKWRFDTFISGTNRKSQRFDFNLGNFGSVDGAAPPQQCQPITGTRICRTSSPTVYKSLEAEPG